MKKIYLFSVQTIVLSLFVCSGCNKDEKVNQLPICSITVPFIDEDFLIDEDIFVTVVAKDMDGAIAEVRLYIDDVEYGFKKTSPYGFVIPAGELDIGTHTLKAVAKDNQGAKGESIVSITISIDGPNYVSFSNGRIPRTWQASGWVVDNTVGYDDMYSLKAIAYPATLIVSKTGNSNVNCVEFYIRNGDFRFFVDGKMLRATVTYGEWIKYSFYLSEGLHTLKWEGFSNSIRAVNIDAIRFSKVDFAVGMYYQGGIITYVDNSGKHGLIAAPSDQSSGIPWCNNLGIYVLTGANSHEIGKGKANTEKIVQMQGSGWYAAKLCDDLVLNGFDDWFLPNTGELHELYKNKHVIGGFHMDNTHGYWSSTEYDNTIAYMRFFSMGIEEITGKTSSQRVRAVRYF